MITNKARSDLDLLQRFADHAKRDLAMTDDELWCWLGHDVNEILASGEGKRRKLRCEMYLEDMIARR